MSGKIPQNPADITLGILGGGQLGRMSAQAAEKLGIPVVIFTPEEGSPASQVAAETIVATYEDEAALTAFAAKVDVISYEFENIPVKTVAFLKNLKPVFPDEHLLEVSQDRISEKKYLNSIGIETTRWAETSTPDEAEKIQKEWENSDIILKTTRFGYDGKGQVYVRADEDIRNAWVQLNSDHIIAEEVVEFECEISVVIARDLDGKTAVYGPQLNKHKNHILHKTIIPAPVSDQLAQKAIAFTENLAKGINLRGVLALEMFVTKEGPGGQKILANEIAPRTHNSGHWTIDACDVSQFENHVRTVCGLPVATPGRHSDAEMINLIGDDIQDLRDYKANENACIHLYGKHDIRAGRKMGHVTLLEKKK